jgi:catechol 2,3-dioxygenase-like lactoylglutathione lyase family enzyme
MAIPARITLITLGVTGVDRATAFYQALGWKLSSASVPGVVSFFHTGGSILAVWGRDELAADARVTSPALDGFSGVAHAINLASPTEVDAALEAAVAAGATLTKPAEHADWGGYSGYFADPDGHLWEIAYNPGWPLDEDGFPQLP